MSPYARCAVLLAVSLAACSSAVERRARASGDSAAVAAAATPAVSATAGAAAAVSGAVATSRAAPTPTRGDSDADSVRGIVERVGSDPTTRLVVRSADGRVCALQLTAPPPFEGLDVALWGTRDRASATMIPGVTCTIAVTRYAVRAVDGMAAVDGTLRIAGAAYVIETADGMRRPLRDVPAMLRTKVGARIYWAGPLDRAPAAYGVLVP